MARSFAEDIVETSTTTGTGAYTLAGPKGDYFPFEAEFVTGDKPVYVVRNYSNSKIEFNRGGVFTEGSPATLTRGVWRSTNGDAPVSWTTDDHPLTIYIPGSAEVHEGVVTGWLATARHALIRAGAMFFTTADVAVSWRHKLATGEATDTGVGTYDAVKGAYFPDHRRYFVGIGAANAVLTAAMAGQTLKFDVTAAARTLTLLAGATSGIGSGFPIYVLPYGGTNAVGLVPNGSEVIDGGTAGATMYVPAGRITAVWWDDVAGQWKTDLAHSPTMLPTGRLTLETGVPVSSTDRTGRTTIYYSPIGSHGMFPFRCGAGFAMFPLTTQLSNDTTASTSGAAGPAALGPYQAVDVYGWLNAGVPTLTRSAKWIKSAPFTVTIATPAVVTCASHGLHDGATWRPTATTGALPTGMALATDYFVTKIDANTFNISTTLANQVAGTKIATSGSQSGTHTGENYTTDRGTGAGTPELAVVNGIRVNAVAITNGPAIGQGTYLGTVYGNASSQIDLKFGSYAAGFGEAMIGIWNAYNRVKVAGTINTSTSSWSVAGAGAQKVFNSSATARASMVSGLAEDCLLAHAQAYITCDGATSLYMGMAFRAVFWTYQATSAYSNNGNASSPFPLATSCTSSPFLGLGFMVPIESVINYTSSYHNNGPSAFMNYDWRY